MPCWEAFEPKDQSGHLVISLGFSVYSEHAHQNQRRFPFFRCWDKEHLPITNTAGAKILLDIMSGFRVVFF